MEDKIKFSINGDEKSIQNPDLNLTLATYLRKTLKLTGTKIGCGTSGCGSCTVTLSQVDFTGKWTHRAINACTTKLWTLHGCHLTSIEGLDKQNPIQQNLHQSHGIQCGFCTPGMPPTVQNKVLDVEDIHKCLQGNICRCTGYRPIVEGMKKCLEQKNLLIPKTRIQIEVMPTFLKNQFDENFGFIPNNLQQVLETTKKNPNYIFVQGGTGKYQMMADQKKKNTNISRFEIYLGQIQELKSAKIDPQTGNVHIGSGLKLVEMEEFLKMKNVKFCQPFLEAFGTLASPQIRNVATIGGSILWRHSSSDLWPLYLIYECQIKILDLKNETESVISAQNIFEYQDRDCLILELIIPNPRDSDIVGKFYKKARRSEFDLAILNMGILAKFIGNRIEFIKIAFGGSDNLLEVQSHDSNNISPSLAKNTMNYLRNQNSSENISCEELMNKIKIDLYGENDQEKISKNVRTKHRISIALHFLKDFLTSFSKQNQANLKTDDKKYKSFKSMQIYQEDEKCLKNGQVYQSVPHIWGQDLASGKAKFISDLPTYEAELELILIRSTKSHAKIKTLDFNEALQMKGIVGCLTAKDLPESRNWWGLAIQDEEIFASEIVWYHGQVIGCIACTDPALGLKALAKIKIEYEDLPPVINLNHAMKILNQDLDSLEMIGEEQTFERIQNPEELKDPNNSLVEMTGTLRIGGAEHFYMETNSVKVVPMIEKEEYIVYVSSQEVTPVQAKIAKVLNIPMHKIIVKNKRLGGGFGGKERMHGALIGSLAAMKFQRPVSLVLTRAEDMEISGQKHEAVLRYQVKVNSKTGKLASCNFKTYVNAGCSADLSPFWAHILMLRIGGGYTLKNFQGSTKVIKTNSPSNTSFRGFGGPEGTFFIETIMDRIAHELKMSPKDVKLANLTADNDLLHHSVTRIKGCTLQKCWDTCYEKSDFETKMQEIADFNSQSKIIKRGLSIVPLKFEPGMGAKDVMKGSAYIRVYKDGSILLTHGGIEMGQGLHTKMIQVASTALDISPDWIHINEVSTETLANTSPTGGSCGTDLNGPAVLDACQTLLKRLEPYKKKNPKGPWSSWITAALADRVSLNIIGYYDTNPTTYDMAKQTGDFYTYLTYGVGTVQAEVNCHTGQVTILSADLVMDLGKSLNPAIDVGQIEGAFIMGLGTVTTEQLVRNVQTGELLTKGPGNYKVPTVADVPKEFNVTLIKNDTDGPTSAIYSSKGIGEPAINFSAGIVIAIKDAIASYRQDNGNNDWFAMEPPCTPTKIWQVAHPWNKINEDLNLIEM